MWTTQPDTHRIGVTKWAFPNNLQNHAKQEKNLN